MIVPRFVLGSEKNIPSTVFVMVSPSHAALAVNVAAQVKPSAKIVGKSTLRAEVR
jgi:hypothetical protein